MRKNVESVLCCDLRRIFWGIREHDEWSLSLTPRDGHDLRPYPAPPCPRPYPLHYSIVVNVDTKDARSYRNPSPATDLKTSYANK